MADNHARHSAASQDLHAERQMERLMAGVGTIRPEDDPATPTPGADFADSETQVGRGDLWSW